MKDDKDRDYWDQVERKAPLTAIKKHEEAAKQLIGLTSLMSTIYFGLVSFNEVLKQVMAGPILLIFILPLLLWLGSLYYATRVIVPQPYDIKHIQKDYVKIGNAKHRSLKSSLNLLIASMFVLIFDVVLYLLWVPAPPP